LLVIISYPHRISGQRVFFIVRLIHSERIENNTIRENPKVSQ
jgi:hypothetical protein